MGENSALMASLCAKSANGQIGIAMTIFVSALAWSPASAPAAIDGEIGTTIVTVKSVTGFLGQLERELDVGSRVHLNEILETGAESHAELELDDDTKLALGPNGRLSLDDYVVGKSEGNARIVLNVLKGAFRFITGDNDKNAYRIDTPSATIGVLGTVFDLYVDDELTLLLVLEGQVQACSTSAPASMAAACSALSASDRLIVACGNGIVSVPIKWSDTLVPGMAISTAFPFLQDAPQVDPVIRAQYSEISDESAEALRLVNQVREGCDL